MKLYFLRHGLAEDRAEWQGADFERPLTEEGKEKMKREAATIANLGLEIDLIVTSPLARAYQTAEIVAKKLDLLDKLITDGRLSPGFRHGALGRLIRAYPKAATLMLVGHEPDFSATISYLIGGGRIDCKKGSLACVDIPDPSRLRGDLMWLLPPKVLAP